MTEYSHGQARKHGLELIGPARVLSGKSETSEVQGGHYKFESITFLFLKKEIYYFGMTYVFVHMCIINYVYTCVSAHE